jgi:translation elongation factor EF-G
MTLKFELDLYFMVPINSTTFVLKLYLETIGGEQRDGRTHKHQTKRRVSHNTLPLSVEGNTKPSAELEIIVDVKYVGEDERTDG